MSVPARIIYDAKAATPALSRNFGRKLAARIKHGSRIGLRTSDAQQHRQNVHCPFLHQFLSLQCGVVHAQHFV
jgi:hypothetical protein